MLQSAMPMPLRQLRRQQLVQVISMLLCMFTCLGILASCAVPQAASPPGGILFRSDRDGNWEIYWMDTDGSNPSPLAAHEAVDDSPAWSPDGSMIAFRSRRDGSSDIFLMDRNGKNIKNLVNDPANSFDDEFSPRWNPDGSQLVIYTDRFQPPLGNCQGGQRGVHHLAFLPLEGGRERIEEFNGLAGEQQSADWSPDGLTLAFSSICGESLKSIYTWQPANGKLLKIIGAPFDASDPAWSPDGKWLAFVSTHSGNSEIYLLNFQENTIENLTNHPAQDTRPTWAPDSLRLAFVTNRDGNSEIYSITLDDRAAVNLTKHPAEDHAPNWSPDWSPGQP